jgi:hypothetical protein
MVQQQSISDMQGDTDPKLMEFLREKVNTFVRWDLIRFFHDNPHAMDTAENIAHYIGREVRPVETELLGLVDDKVLKLNQNASVKVFSLASDPTIREMVNRFVLACDDRQFRVKAINQVIRGMS